LEGQEGGWI